MEYTVKQLAKLAGVSARTIHYYDEIGLLKPSFKEKNGYRKYEEKELLKMQQILFFRELDFSLEKIKNIFASPKFDPIGILKDQRRLIEFKKERLEKIINTINATINRMKTKKKITGEQLFGSLTKEEYEKYKKEAQERWGKKNVQRSENIVKGWGKQKIEELEREGKIINEGLAELIALPVEDSRVQALIARHFNYIIQFYDKTWPLLKIYRGLGKMYVEDERFAKNYSIYHPDLPKFMCSAMEYYCDQKEKN